MENQAPTPSAFLVRGETEILILRPNSFTMLRFCFVLASISIHLTLAVSASDAELLWRLTNHAIQRRQSSYPWDAQHYHHVPRPSWSHSFMEALDSIVSNDALRCVPRLLCEVTSGQAQVSKNFGLPFDINAESLVGLISAVNSPSPIVTFAKAAFLGLTSKGDLSRCYHSYPTCPKDPDKLMQYLNNHNGGFFRFFSGMPASKRILNNPAAPGDKFTFHAGLRSPKILTFPKDDKEAARFQRPPVGHVKVPMVFPDRTGTGELRLDLDELGSSSNELYGDYKRLKFNKVFRFPGENF